MGYKQHPHNHEHTQRHEVETPHAKPAGPEGAMQERIRMRAYELSQTEPGGSAMQDWLCAEREVLGVAAAAPPGQAPDAGPRR